MTDSTLQEMLPCPFCGGDGSKKGAMITHYVDCARCKATAGNYHTAEQAITAWNTRTPVPKGGCDGKRLD